MLCSTDCACLLCACRLAVVVTPDSLAVSVLYRLKLCNVSSDFKVTSLPSGSCSPGFAWPQLASHSVTLEIATLSQLWRKLPLTMYSPNC